MPAKLLVLLINLDRSVERLNSCLKTFQSEKIDFIRLPAVDGRTLRYPIPGIDTDLYRRCHGSEIKPGTIGCFLSHLKAYHTFLKSDYDYAVILEDDFEFISNAKSVLDDLAHNNLYGVDVIRIEQRRRGLSFKLGLTQTGHELRVMATRVTGTKGYILNRRAATIYLNNLMPMEAPIDHVFDRCLHLGISMAFLKPSIVVPSIHQKATTIGVDPSKKVSLIQKFSVLKWRAFTEIARFINAISEYLRRKIFQPILVRAPFNGKIQKQLEEIWYEKKY